MKYFKIKTQIIILYVTIFMISFLFFISSFTVINNRFIENEVGNGAMQTVLALDNNLKSIIENVTEFSNHIFFDSNVQNSLSNIKSDSINLQIQRTIQQSLSNTINSSSYISSVFIFDKYNNNYSSYKLGPYTIENKNIQQTKWYNEVKALGGSILFVPNCDGFIKFGTDKTKEFISLIREIKDIYTYERLATLILNIDVSSFQKRFEEVGAEYNSQFCIINSNNEYIIKPSNYDIQMDNYIFDSNLEDSKYKSIKFQNKNTILLKKSLNIQDWSIVGLVPIQSTETIKKYYNSLFIIVILINMLFILLCTISLTKLIFNPLNSMQKHMKLVENGEFIEMEIGNYNNEINSLKKVFNQMINSIKNLICQIKAEEKIILKNELDIIQAQINPHFLYNTLDAISALALIKDNENCVKITQALSIFYRNSLNSGKDIVTVNDEIECIKSYITILNIRYDNKIVMEYDIENEIKDKQILKLILQPIIENAVYHGIRNKIGKGKICIKGYCDEDEIIFIINDDGLGMSEQKILDILSGKRKTKHSGFGLYSSIQRISIFYNIENPITINSELGSGTEITIRVKMMGVNSFEGINC